MRQPTAQCALAGLHDYGHGVRLGLQQHGALHACLQRALRRNPDRVPAQSEKYFRAPYEPCGQLASTRRPSGEALMTHMTSRFRVVLASAGLAYFAVAFPAAGEVPDLTGVWTNYRNP